MRKRFKNTENTVYASAAKYTARYATIVVSIDRNDNYVTSGTILKVAQETAVAMAMASTKAKFIVCNSKTAILQV